MYSPLISIITFVTALKVYIIGWDEPHLFNKLIKKLVLIMTSEVVTSSEMLTISWCMCQKYSTCGKG